MNQDKFMRLPLTKMIFKAMFRTKKNSIGPVLAQYNVEEPALYETLWEKFNVPGMEVRIANTAFDFLIDCCRDKKDLCDTLKEEIGNVILMSSVFYTNVAPDANYTSDFKIPGKE